MKRRAALGVALICSFAVAGVALADRLPRTLDGDLERGGEVVIEISKGRAQGAPVERYRWDFRQISVRCDGERHLARASITGGFAINADFGGPGDWGVQGEIGGDPSDPTYATKVRGRLVTWNRARGWIRLWGSRIPLRGGGRAECDSGRLHWVARK
jgi:hypothetical protein